MSTPHSPDSGPAIRRAVIPAAGLGTRLQPLTSSIPKEMLPVGRLPVLAHIAAELRGAGITDALFVVSDQKPQIRAFFGDSYRGAESTSSHVTIPPLRCHYITQVNQRGLGDALLYAEEWVAGEPFVVAFGDCMMDAVDPSAPLRRLIDDHLTQYSGATALAEEVARDQVFRYGVLAPKLGVDNGARTAIQLSDVVEKPSPEEAPSNLVVAGRWALNPTVFGFLKQTALDARGELTLTDAVRAMVAAGHAFWATPLLPGEMRFDIGNFETYFASFIRAALRDSEFGESARRTAQAELAAKQSQ